MTPLANISKPGLTKLIQKSSDEKSAIKISKSHKKNEAELIP